MSYARRFAVLFELEQRLTALRLPRSSELILALCFAVAWVTALFLWQRHFDFNIADGGFLWYGAQRTLAGDVPLRDFMAYDPGRYWLAAGFMAAAHDNGMITLRAWMYLVEAVAVGLVVMTVARARGGLGPIGLCFVAVLTSLWMYPEHKTIDILMSIAIVPVLSLLIQKPTARRFFWAGVYIGISAVIGRNHGVYGVAACLLTIVLLGVKHRSDVRLVRNAACGVAGIVMGFLPIIISVLSVKGFGAAFMQSVLLNLKSDSTNLPLPVPWPWLVTFGAQSAVDIAQKMAIGLSFLALPLFLVAGLIRLFRLESQEISSAHSVFAAAVIAAVPYTHYAFSRADPTHLSHSIFPMLIGLICWPATNIKIRRWTIFALLVVSVLGMLPLMPRIEAWRNGNWQLVTVGGDTLVVPPDTAGAVRFLQSIDQQFVPKDKTLLVAPLWPSAYPLLGKVAPVWDLYGLFHRDRQFEEAEIRRLQRAPVAVAVAVILDGALDGRDDLRFKNTHPLMQRYLETHYREVPSASPAPSLHVYVPISP